MKTDLDHLPEEKQQELRLVVELILSQVQPRMIILFGSYARGDWVEERVENGHHWQYQSDYDILVIVDTRKQAKKSALWHGLWKQTQEFLSTPVGLISHDFEYIKQKIDYAEYFFVDIFKEGILLFSDGTAELPKPKPLDNRRRYLKAEEDFHYWFDSAKDFFGIYLFCKQENKMNLAAFNLHQAVEHCYSAVLLVFTNYKPKTHDLRDLGKKVAAQDSGFLVIFPQGSEQERRLFELLRSAYVDARYKKAYSIAEEELAWLEQRVNQLFALAKQTCHHQLSIFEKLATIDAEINTENSAE